MRILIGMDYVEKAKMSVSEAARTAGIDRNVLKRY
jgi:hypothetical protein